MHFSVRVATTSFLFTKEYIVDKVIANNGTSNPSWLIKVLLVDCDGKLKARLIHLTNFLVRFSA